MTKRPSTLRAILRLPLEQRIQVLERAANCANEAYVAGEYETFESLDEDYREDPPGE